MIGDLGITVGVKEPIYEINTLILNANGGTFQDGTNQMKVKWSEGEITETVTKYSHTSNISDSGTQSGNYSNSVSTNEVITIDGATNLHVSITYSGESINYDWACMWVGNYPSYTAANNYSSSLTGKLGGSPRTTKEYDVEGDTVTFGFKSDGSGVGDGYGYYAVITGQSTTTGVIFIPEMEEPTKESETFAGWFYDTDFLRPFDKNNLVDSAYAINLYAKYE